MEEKMSELQQQRKELSPTSTSGRAFFNKLIDELVLNDTNDFAVKDIETMDEYID